MPGPHPYDFGDMGRNNRGGGKRSKRRRRSKRNGSKKRRSSKRRTKIKRYKKRRQRKYIQKGGDKLQIWTGSPGQWNERDITYNTDNIITVGDKEINFSGGITAVNSGGTTRYQIRQPDNTIITIKLIDPANIEDLKRNIARLGIPEEERPERRRRIE